MKEALFDRFTIEMTLDDAMGCSHQGRCDEDVEATVEFPYIAKQLDYINPESIKDELREYGAWDEVELDDEGYNEQRIIWMAAGHIREESHDKDTT